MRAGLARSDAWCRGGDFTVKDIAIFRIIYGTALLSTLQQIGWYATFPSGEFDPPPGPIMLFGALPSVPTLEVLELVIAVLTALLVLGLHTRAVSLLLAVALTTGLGLTYSFGQIDHTIVLILVPATMAFSAWGDALSVDATRARSNAPIAQWPMRLLALLVSLAFLTAGIAKLRSGWLDPGTHAVQGHLVHGYFATDRTDWFASRALDFQADALWEVLDWMTVGLELGLVLAVLSWRWFRVALAVTALFHLSVLLLMNIAFRANVIGYGAFFRWSSYLPSRPGSRLRLTRPVGYLIALASGGGMYVLHESVGDALRRDAGVVLVFLGAGLGAAYLAAWITRVASVARAR